MIKKQILNYRIVGNGYPVVFLHGFLESNNMWDNLIKHFPHIQAICIDLPGHGKSNLLKEDLSLVNITKAVKQTILEITTEHYSIIGHSLGGYVALHLAEDNALKIDQITLLHSHPWSDSVNKKVGRGRAAKIVKYNKIFFLKEAIPNLYHSTELFETKINHLIDEAYEMKDEAIIQTLYAMRDREEKNEVLKTWKNRIQIIQGEFDSLIDTKKLQKQAEENNNYFQIIESIGHMGHHENEKEVVKLIAFMYKKTALH